MIKWVALQNYDRESNDDKSDLANKAGKRVRLKKTEISWCTKIEKWHQWDRKQDVWNSNQDLREFPRGSFPYAQYITISRRFSRRFRGRNINDLFLQYRKIRLSNA